MISSFIANQFCNGKDSQVLSVYDPKLGTKYESLVCAGQKDTLSAIEAANEAYPFWKKLTVNKRASYLLKIADLMEERLEKLAEIEARDSGKLVEVAKTIDIPRSIKNFRFFAKFCQSHYEDKVFIEKSDLESYKSVQSVSSKESLGVVALITPWNLPLYLLTWKLAPALMMGNTVIAKPSELTPASAHELAKISVEAGLPKGVLNILHGPGQEIGQILCQDKRVKAISFTGSTQTGRKINQLASSQFKKVSLEMGGKNAQIVFNDCDLEKAVSESVRSCFSNQGQICLCSSRLYIQEDIYDEFKHKFIEAASRFPMGALISFEHRQKVLAYIEQAKSAGKVLEIAHQNKNLPKGYQQGYFLSPYLLEGLSHDHPCVQEEIFGPVVCLFSFKYETNQDHLDLVQKVNDSKYGLAGSIFSEDLDKVQTLAKQVDTGMLWINTWMKRDLKIPFGGSKESGLGREGGKSAMAFFSQTKTITRLV